ncbi:C6 transcription factor AlcR [Fonsecaea pedrosoi]|nr:C6 transcription factor AlcR [Fonsecaea pedrosoi]
MAQTVALRRRQNKSCDQCRAGKRRCDVEVAVHEAPTISGLNFSSSDDHDAMNVFASSPCTNCKKWKKACTIEWIKSHQRRQSTTSKRRRGSKGMSHAVDDTASQDVWADGVSNLPQEDIDSMLTDSLNRSISRETFPDGSIASLSTGTMFESLNGSQHDDSASLMNSQLNQPFYDLTPVDCPEPYPTNYYMAQPMLDPDVAIDGQSSTSYLSDGSNSWSQPISNPQSVVDSQDQESVVQERRFSPPFYGNGLTKKTASPFASHFLAEDHSRLYIKKGLLKIYHDSLEGALSCWLIERNCPYASSPFMDQRDAWSSKWSNRIVTRVRALDDAYARSGLLSQSDQKQASNVLSLVVMAFAVQWAQSPFGKHDNLSTQLPEHGIFGRNMQKALWQKASAALNQAVGNPSFKVIFATIIFSLTQRPIESAEVLPSPGSRRQNDLASLRKILDHDTGPIFLDVAVRKLHDHQRRLKDAERSQNGSHVALQTSIALGEQDKQTFGLMFWLAIMFDTISAAMNRRTFALSDGETSITDDEPIPAPRLATSVNGYSCDLDGYSGFSNMNSAQLSRESQVWGNYFLRQQSRIGDVRKQTTRWPCSYVDAAACLADAAPVKVLVFRRVGHLQDLYYQRATADAIENAIASTLEVYNHWNNTYGRFISDCIANHESLPARIQSWYILLASHWHLAILILADLIEKLDDSNMTLPANRTARQTTEFSAALRFRSVYAVSDLGRCSRFSNEDLSFSQSPDFHHAVNKAALLTEPWTVVLVRSFAQAGEVLVKLVLSRREPGLFMDTNHLSEARSRLNDCIEALWLLGRKSDMALSAAKILQEAVNQGMA